MKLFYVNHFLPRSRQDLQFQVETHYNNCGVADNKRKRDGLSSGPSSPLLYLSSAQKEETKTTKCNFFTQTVSVRPHDDDGVTNAGHPTVWSVGLPHWRMVPRPLSQDLHKYLPSLSVALFVQSSIIIPLGEFSQS